VAGDNNATPNPVKSIWRNFASLPSDIPDFAPTIRNSRRLEKYGGFDPADSSHPTWFSFRENTALAGLTTRQRESTMRIGGTALGKCSCIGYDKMQDASESTGTRDFTTFITFHFSLLVP